jgi:hypothetical protein
LLVTEKRRFGANRSEVPFPHRHSLGQLDLPASLPQADLNPVRAKLPRGRSIIPTRQVPALATNPRPAPSASFRSCGCSANSLVLKGFDKIKSSSPYANSTIAEVLSFQELLKSKQFHVVHFLETGTCCLDAGIHRSLKRIRRKSCDSGTRSGHGRRAPSCLRLTSAQIVSLSIFNGVSASVSAVSS